MTYQVVKRYGYNEGWSCCFRQHLASHSHCRFLHGYALAFEFTFESENLDHCNWVIDFGGLKGLKAWLKSTFDHRTIVAEDDPWLNWFQETHSRGLIDLLVVPAVGCEKFAEYIYVKAVSFLPKECQCTLTSVRVQEHEGNSGLYRPV